MTSVEQRTLLIQLNAILSTIEPVVPVHPAMQTRMLRRKKRDFLTKHKDHPNASDAIVLIEKLLLENV
jgi:hypothetical protein